MPANTPIGVAVVGYGYWSPKLIRNIASNPAFSLRAICEKDVARHASIREAHPDIAVCRHYRDAFGRPDVGAVVIATIPSSHYRIAKLALESGKHVLVEKPLTLTVEEGEVLVELARARRAALMVDHTFLYAPAVQRLAALVREGTLGSLYSIESTRANLGLFQRDTNVLWDLAPHDLSILLALTDERPSHVRALGSVTVVHPRQDRAQESDCHLILSYPSGTQAHVFVSWTSPVKVRRLVVVGSERMALYDLLDPEPLKVFDQGVYPVESDGESGPLFQYKTGPTTSVELPAGGEDLARMIEDFAHAIRTGAEPRSNARLGLEVVRILAAAQRSLERDGAKISLDSVAASRFRKWLVRWRPR